MTDSVHYTSTVSTELFMPDGIDIDTGDSMFMGDDMDAPVPIAAGIGTMTMTTDNAGVHDSDQQCG